MAPPKPTIPATEPTDRPGARSVGRIMTRVDQDCCPKNATLKIAIAKSTGALSTNRMTGITAALAPSANFRAKHPPPNPEAAYGIHA